MSFSRRPRYKMRLAARVAGVIALSPGAGTAAEDIKHVEVLPFCYYAGLEVTGAAVAEVAVHSPNPVVFGAGMTFKFGDFAINTTNDVATAAIGHRDRWLGAQMALSDQDAQRLKQIKAAGGNLNGPEANAIKERLRERIYEIQSPQRGRLGYTTSVVLQNLPYAVAEVGIDKLIEKSVGLAIEKSGAFEIIEKVLPLPKAVRWAVKNNGPLGEAEKEAGWRKLGRLAHEAEQATADALLDQASAITTNEATAVANFFANDRVSAIKESAADALTKVYEEWTAAHPSAPRRVALADVRLEAARAAVVAPPLPLAVAPAAIRADPVVRIINADDATWARRTDAPPRLTFRAQRPPLPLPAPAQAPQLSARDQARWAELHAELMRVGDGKTFTVCSNGCPATAESSWDGRRGQGLYSR